MDEQTERTPTPNYIRSFVHNEVKEIDREARAVTHIITTLSVDRDGDVVEPSGVRLDNYRKNPVVVADHAYSVEKVIGRAVSFETKDDRIVATTRFRETPLAEDAYRLAMEGLGGWSIGFRPSVSHTVRDGMEAECKRCKKLFDERSRGKKPGDRVPGMYGMHFVDWELLEYSMVAIPSNPDAVNQAVKRGLLHPENVRTFFLPSVSEPDPPDEGARDGATEKGVERVVRVHPALADLIRRAERRLAAHEIGRHAAELVKHDV